MQVALSDRGGEISIRDRRIDAQLKRYAAMQAQIPKHFSNDYFSNGLASEKSLPSSRLWIECKFLNLLQLRTDTLQDFRLRFIDLVRVERQLLANRFNAGSAKQ